jgi:hypothetical protein
MDNIKNPNPLTGNTRRSLRNGQLRPEPGQYKDHRK